MDGHRDVWRRWRWRAIAAAICVIGSTQSAELLMLAGAISFGFLVRHPAALLLALLPFLVSLPDATGDGDPPDWVASLVFATPVLALFIGAGVLLGLLFTRLRRLPTR
jgi:hypothetical protein